MSLRFAWAAVCLLAGAGDLSATNELSEAEHEGRRLVEQLLEQRPAENSSFTGVLKIRDGKGRRTEIPVRFQVDAAEFNSMNWLNLYETAAASNQVTLRVSHSGNQPNAYRLRENGAQTTLTGNETMVPFAGSDFWAADLGLEFLHWPSQRLLKKELRRSQSCYRIESTNPAPAPGAYARVVSWITIEPPHGIVHAEAYDAQGKLLKEFDPKTVKKVNGQWELQEMEIRNPRTGSRTRLEFDLDKK